MPLNENAVVSAGWIANADNNKRSYEPQRKNQFRLEVSLPGSSQSEEILARSARVISWPEFNISVIPVEFVNEIRHVAGRHEQAPIEITLLDFIGQDSTESVLWNWITKVYNPETGEMGYANEYTAPVGDLQKLDPHGIVHSTWRLVNVWPFKWKTGEGDMGAAEKSLTSVTFQCDKFYRVEVNS